MTCRLKRQCLVVMGTVVGVALVGATLGYGEPGETGNADASATPAGTTSAVAEVAGEKTPRAKSRGRLPVYFSRVVDDGQRERIYDIQQSYAEQMEPLRQQLAQLSEQMRSEVREVLDDEQRQEVDRLIAAARARREAAKAQRDAARAAGSESATGE